MAGNKITNLISSKKCNNSCRICARSQEDIHEMGIAEIESRLKSLKKEGYNNIILTGGEPTLRKDFLKIIEMFGKEGFSRLHIQTNGRKFSDFSFAKKAVSENRNIIDIFLSIHGHNADLHEKITGTKGSFIETETGIENLLSLKLPVRTNTVVTKINYRFLDEIAEFLIAKGVRTIQFSFVHPRGEALTNQLEMVPKIEDTISFLRKALNRNSDDIKIFTEAFPFCLLGENHVLAAERVLPHDYRATDFSKIKGIECKKCCFDRICPGIWKSYYSLKGFKFNCCNK